MPKKLYLVTDINDQDWENIFSCIRFASKFSDKGLKSDDMRILKNIKVRDLDQDKDIKKCLEKWLYKGD